MAEVLAFICPGLFKYEFPVVSASCKELVSKVVGSFHYFSPEIIGKPIVNEHHVLHCGNSFPSLFGKPVLFVHV